MKPSNLIILRSQIKHLEALNQTLLSSESGVGISAKSVGMVLERMIEALQEITEYLEKNQSHEI